MSLRLPLNCFYTILLIKYVPGPPIFPLGPVSPGGPSIPSKPFGPKNNKIVLVYVREFINNN